MGRPSKLDDLRAKRIVDAVANGVSRAGAAKAAGIAISTLSDWLARGRDGEAPFSAFSDRVREAEGRAETTVVNALFEQVQKGHVGAICFWLERRRHQDWGKRDSVVHEHVDVDAPREQVGGDLELARSVVAALESRKAV